MFSDPRIQIAKTLFHQANTFMEKEINRLVSSGISPYESIMLVKEHQGTLLSTRLEQELKILGADPSVKVYV